MADDPNNVTFETYRDPNADDGPFGEPDTATWFTMGGSDLAGGILDFISGKENPHEVRKARNRAAADMTNMINRFNRIGVSPFFSNYGNTLNKRYNQAQIAGMNASLDTHASRGYDQAAMANADAMLGDAWRQQVNASGMRAAIDAAGAGMLGGGPSVADARLANAQAMAGLQQSQGMQSALEQAAAQQASSRGGALAALQANRANAGMQSGVAGQINAGLLDQSAQSAALRSQEQADAARRYMGFLGQQSNMYGDSSQTMNASGDIGLKNLQSVQARMDLYDRQQRNLQGLRDAYEAREAQNLLNSFGMNTGLAVQGVGLENQQRAGITNAVGSGIGQYIASQQKKKDEEQ